MALTFAGLDPRIRPYAAWAVQVAGLYGLRVTITSVRRTWAEQDELWRRWLARPARCEALAPGADGCPWPANVPGTSLHEWGLAWDSVISPDTPDAWALWTAIREAAGFRVPAHDRIHAEPHFTAAA